MPIPPISSNIPKFYLFRATWMFVLIFSINIAFLSAAGLSVTQITLLDVIWALAALSMEVPTGALSDRWSRKGMLVLSSLFAPCGLLTYAASGTFLPFALATILMAARSAFSSGTANALVYDSLKQLGREAEFEQVLGRAGVVAAISASLAGIVGASLASIDFRLPFVVSAAITLVAALVALTFREPVLRATEQREEVGYLRHINQAARYAVTHPALRFLLAYVILMDVAVSHLDEYDQLYLADIGFPLAYFGLWIALRRSLGAVGGLLADRARRLLGEHAKTYALGSMIAALLAIALGHRYIGLGAFLAIFLIWGAAGVLVTGELHASVESHQRATVESLFALAIAATDVVVRLSFGYVSDAYGIRGGYGLLAMVLSAYALYFLWSKRRGVDSWHVGST